MVYQHGGMLLGSIVLLGLFGLNGVVSPLEGLLLIIVYALYLVLLLTDSESYILQVADEKPAGLFVSTAYLVVGLAIVTGSAELTVESATRLAVAFNIEQSFIAIIIIGLGSSLPELSISLAAVLKRRAHLSVGNLVGSNIFDTLIPVGVAATIAELQFSAKMLHYEIPFLFFLTGFVLILFARKKGLTKREGSMVLGLYVIFAAIKLATAEA